MEENKKPLFDPESHCREALMTFIAKHGRIGREQLLDTVFRAYDKAMSELVRSGKVIVVESSQNESHLDLFVLATSEQS